MMLLPRRNVHHIASCFSFYLKKAVPVEKTFSTNAALNLHQSTNNRNETIPDKSVKKFVKNYALYVGYRGADYHGIAVISGQKHVSTVGSIIIGALVKSGYLDESEFDSAHTLSMTSRTDRGVSALRQLITVHLRETIDLEKVTKFLPHDIKIFGVTQTTRNFKPHRYCNGRSYLYYIPSYVFAPQTIDMDKEYRLDCVTIDKIKNELKKFLGTQNYHNFTSGRGFQDPRSKRTIREADLEPIVMDDIELVCIRLSGDSFIFNQIRKMVGAIATVVRGYAPENLIDMALSRQGMAIPRAPGDGLLLENVYFHFYNKRFEKTHEPLDWSKFDNEVNELKNEILSGVISKEKKYDIFKLWMDQLQFMPCEPFNKEENSLNGQLCYDDSLKIIRSDHVSVSGGQAATLFI